MADGPGRAGGRTRVALAALAAAGVATSGCAASGAAGSGSAHGASAHAAPAAAAPAAYGPVAVIYHIPGKPYFRVHNALELADQGWRVKVAHVSAWPAYKKNPPADVFWVCYQPSKHPKKSCGPKASEQWVVDRVKRYPATLGAYRSGPAIAFRPGSADPHNGAFACLRPHGAKTCARQWPGDDKILKVAGTLRYLHYVNPPPAPKGDGRYAIHIKDFEFRPGFVGEPRPGEKTVSAQRICRSLPKPCSRK